MLTIDYNEYSVEVLAREDDVINVAGHRLSTSALEEVVLSHPDVGDGAVVGVNDKLRGQVPLGLVVLKTGCTRPVEQVGGGTC